MVTDEIECTDEKPEGVLTFSEDAEISESGSNEVLMIYPAFHVTILSSIARFAINPASILLVGQGLSAALIIRLGSLRHESHGTISLEVGERAARCIDGELIVVGAQSMTMSVRVRE